MIKPQELTSNVLHDKVATTYGLSFHQSYTQYLKYLLIEQLASSTDICLDVGIATGIYSLPLADKVQSIHGIDISAPMLAECQKNIDERGYQNIHLHEMSATQLDFPDQTFDLIYAYSVLLLIPEIDLAFQEIARVIKPKGHAVLDITGRYNLSQIRWRRYYRQLGHFGLHAFTLEKMKAKLASYGFDILEIHATGCLDQWKYIRGLDRLTFLDKVTHASSQKPDLDYRISQRFPRFANRWYVVVRKSTNGYYA